MLKVKNYLSVLVLLCFSGCQNGGIPEDLKTDIADMKLMLDNGDKVGLIENYGWDYHEYVRSIGKSDEALNNMASKVDDNLVAYLDAILISEPYKYNDEDPESYEFRVEGEFVADMPIYFIKYKKEETWKILFP